MWEDDGCESLRIAAVSSLDLHPRARRALEVGLRSTATPDFFREHTVEELAGVLRLWWRDEQERLRTERLEAEAQAAGKATRSRNRARVGGKSGWLWRGSLSRPAFGTRAAMLEGDDGADEG